MRNPRVFLSAGEASGDAYGAALIAVLRARLGGATVTGLGGAQMAAEGQQQTVRAEDVAHMGITEVLLHAPYIFGQYRRLVASLRKDRPDVAVLIDFPDVNFRLAKHLRRAGVPVVWFVSPQLWAWKRRRLRWVQERVDKMLVIFPFEERFYRERGVDAEFVGHPLAAQPAPQRSREDFAAAYGLDPHKKWIALLPGSRWKEVQANLPVMHEMAIGEHLRAVEDQYTVDDSGLHLPAEVTTSSLYEFLLPVASTLDPAELQARVDRLTAQRLQYFLTEGQQAASLPHLTLIHGPDAAYESLLHAAASVVASGTATVLAALAGNPFVVVYRVSALTFALARRLVRYPEEIPAPLDAFGNPPVGMVNLIVGDILEPGLGNRAVPEFLQERFTAANIAKEVFFLTEDTLERDLQVRWYLKEVRKRLLAPGAASPIERVADAVLALLHS